MKTMLKLLALSIAIFLPTLASAMDYCGKEPGLAKISIKGKTLHLRNQLITSSWNKNAGKVNFLNIKNLVDGTEISPGQNFFKVEISDDKIFGSSDFKLQGKINIQRLEGNKNAARTAQHHNGVTIGAELLCPEANLKCQWRAELRDGANYLRQFFVFSPITDAVKIKKIVLIDLAATKPAVIGSVDGSPVVAGNMFFAYEHPMSKSKILDPAKGTFQCTLERNQTLAAADTLAQTSVIGVVPKGQLRRGFAYYVERERAHGYRPFLHYNSWYDITQNMGSQDRKIVESDCLKVVKSFSKEFVKKQGVTLDSFVWDDGWDDNNSLWGFSDDFPKGLDNLKKLADKVGVAQGVWMSPWGGYGEKKAARLVYGKSQGYEINENGFSLAGPKYFAKFRQTCIDMVQKFGVNYFKFDGVGAGNGAPGAGVEYTDDIEAMLKLIDDIRSEKHDIFINTTVGSWPSVYWLWHCDSIWRAGHDWNVTGKGSKRQQWITYRDAEVYKNVVKRAPLYPLNSLMVTAFILAKTGYPQKPLLNPAVMDGKIDEFKQDLAAFFGSGTNCQELYVSWELMKLQHWKTLADASKWSRANSQTLLDSHWVGGDPAKLQVYGYACWSPAKAILTLRNPDDKTRSIDINAQAVFELPEGIEQQYQMTSVLDNAPIARKLILDANRKVNIELAPFETIVFETK
jgi:hypothetical protein